MCRCFEYMKIRQYGLCLLIISPSGARALTLAAGRNVGGHYKWHFFLFISSFFQLIANSPRRGCCRVPKSCMGS